MTKNYFFTLGASDPEMNAIEKGIRALFGESAYGYACDATGKRVTPANAYKATHILLTNGSFGPGGFVQSGCQVTVECKVTGVTADLAVDHHNPGDVGYGRPVEDYLEASSIGQVVFALVKDGFTDAQILGAFGDMRFLRLVAAGDHCPGAAYQGKCPGVDPQALKAYRAANQAAFQKLTPSQLEEQVNIACDMLQSLPRFTMAGVEVADATGMEIRSLNEASLILNIPVQYSMAERDGSTKVGLLAGEFSEVVREWMSAQAGKLDRIYGDPSRGYAGGYRA